jgi:ribose transport system permease protein
MIPLHKFLELTQSHRWIWSALAVLIFWGALSVVTDRFSVASLSGIVLSASYLSIVGVGQMFVVTTGRANIDLSIASVVTLSAYVALLTVGGRDANLIWGVLVAFGLGLVVGCVNAALVVRLRVPAIIATLATGYVLATATLLCNRSIHGFAVSPTLRAVAAGRFLGAPILLLVCFGLIALAEFVLQRTVWTHLERGRAEPYRRASGQNSSRSCRCDRLRDLERPCLVDGIDPWRLCGWRVS